MCKICLLCKTIFCYGFEWCDLMFLRVIKSKSVKLDFQFIAFVYVDKVINTQWIQCILVRGIDILCSG